MKKTIQILSLLVGIVFLVSGIGKAVAAYEFSQLLVQYGFDALRFLAPLIIVFEVTIGLALFLGFRLKQTGLLAFCFTGLLSLGYLYGYYFKNITDCGCFGQFSFLNLSPLFTCIRNLVLLGILLFVFLKNDNPYQAAKKNDIVIMACILCAVCFVTGYTFVEPQIEATQYVTKGKHINIEVENSVLGEFLTFSKDSTYLVFAFSYGCPHCYNSIENLKQYERLGVVDRILAFSYANNSATEEKFNELFKPNFQINNYPSKQLFRLTNRFPVSYYVKNNRIRMEIRGPLPCGLVMQGQLSKVE